MIQPQSILRVADNSGAQTVKCIKILNKSKFAYIGDCILVSIKSLKFKTPKIVSSKRRKASPQNKGGGSRASGQGIYKGQICKALIIRTKSRSATNAAACSTQKIRGRGQRRCKMGIQTSAGTTTTVKHGSQSFQTNDVVLIDNQSSPNPIGSRVFGPVTRDLRAKNYNKVISQSKRML